jgi:hypothetical protein
MPSRWPPPGRSCRETRCLRTRSSTSTSLWPYGLTLGLQRRCGPTGSARVGAVDFPLTQKNSRFTSGGWMILRNDDSDRREVLIRLGHPCPYVRPAGARAGISCKLIPQSQLGHDLVGVRFDEDHRIAGGTFQRPCTAGPRRRYGFRQALREEAVLARAWKGLGCAVAVQMLAVTNTKREAIFGKIGIRFREQGQPSRELPSERSCDGAGFPRFRDCWWRSRARPRRNCTRRRRSSAGEATDEEAS